MTWLLWRQHRSHALVVLLFVVGVAGITIAAGLHIRSTYDSYGLGSCEAGSGNGCEGLSPTFQFMGASMIAAVGLTLLAFAVFRLRRGIR